MTAPFHIRPELLQTIIYQCIRKGRAVHASDEEMAFAMAETFAEDFEITLRPDGPVGVMVAMSEEADA